jgi:hypothetical protein
LIAVLLLGSLVAGVRAQDRERQTPISGDATSLHLRQARVLRARSRQDLADAVAQYRAVLRRAPHQLEAERGLARSLRGQGREEEALPALRDVAALSGEGLDSARLAWALFRAGHWAEAADAFTTAREHGQNDPETVRGAALAATAARAALSSEGARGEAMTGGAVPAPSDAGPSGWQRAWSGLWSTTGTITAFVQRLLLTVIALIITGGIVLRVWSTLMGREVPPGEGGMRLRQFRGLRAREIDTGRPLGRVRSVVYDPKLSRVVGFQVGGRWRRRVMPSSAVRGCGPAGLLLSDADALLPASRAGELGALARAGTLPLGSGNRLQRVVSEEGTLLAFTRPHRLWINGATGRVSFEVTPNRYHDAWRVALAVLQFGPIDWLLGNMLDWGLELLPGRLSARIRLPVSLVRSADREVVIVSPEAAEWIEQHFQQLEQEARARLSQVKEGVARARPVVQAGVDKAKPVVQAGVAKARPVVEAGVARARPVLERARDQGAALARRSAEAVGAAGRKAGSVDAQTTPDSGDEVHANDRPTELQ